MKEYKYRKGYYQCLRYKVEDTDDAWWNLMLAIIQCAIMDYNDALKKDRKADIRQLERFFRSAYFSSVSGFDGELIIGNIRRRLLHNARNPNRAKKSRRKGGRK